MTSYVLLVPRRGVTASIAPNVCTCSLDLVAAGIFPLAADACLFSFQRLANQKPTYLPFDSCTRLELEPGKRHFVVIGAQADSSYADLILWDLAHALPTGGTFTLIEPFDFQDCILSRAYFDGIFDTKKSTVQGWSKWILTKQQETLSESDRGVGRWTFGLPVGTATQAIVDQLAGQIEKLGLDQWELLFAVSNTPAAGLLDLPDNVRVVSCLGANITEKKNRIAEHANHPNLCLFHDRVELPRSFKSAVERFGDNYAICGFQQLLFDSARDSLERYSDYHIDLGDGNLLLGVDGPQGSSSLYVNALDTRLCFRARFAEAHPAEYDRRNYLTGSLYLAKRSIWRLVGQHADIEWNELEDVEFGSRAINEFGIPSRLNPYAFAFTSRVRAILVGSHEIASRKGGAFVVRVTSDYRTGPVSSKATGLEPLVMRQRAWQLYREFGLPEHDFEMRAHIFTAPLKTQRQYADFWIRLLYRVGLSRRASRVKQFLLMFSNAAYGFSFDPGTLNALTSNICSGAFFIDQIVRDNYFMRSLANVPNLINGKPETSSDVLYEQALRMWRRGGDYIYPYDSFEELLTTIEESI